MKDNPEVSLFMLCNPYNPVGEGTDTEVEADGSREREGGEHMLRCCGSCLLDACADFTGIYHVRLFLQLSRWRRPRLKPGADMCFWAVLVCPGAHRQQFPLLGPRDRGQKRVGGGVLVIMHGPSGMAIDSYPYNAGTEHAWFSPTRQTLLAPNAKRREVFGESPEG